MIDIFEDEIHRLPEKAIPRGDYIYLGYVDGYDALLCVEEWEFRVYNYEFWGEEDILDNHEDEDWRACRGDYFEWATDCLDKDTLQYTTIMFDNTKDTYSMACELLKACESALEDLSRSIFDEWETRIPSATLLSFLEGWKQKLNKCKAYFYYK